MATPSPTSSPPSSHSNPNSAATSPHQNPPPSTSEPLPPAQTTTLVASAVAKKTQPVLWTQEETLLLIDSYKDKWHALGRGPLKSSHWEEIAAAVSARSGVDRSATQCRHKIEKLRKRLRAERQSMGPISIWPFYSQMEELDSNNNSAAPISARPLTRLPPVSDDDEDEEEEEERESKSRSINYIVRRPGAVNRFAGVGGGLLQWGHKERSKRKRRTRRRDGARAVACEIRDFAERVMVMEKRKMEFARESVKLRKEMEIKRIRLIQSSQAQLLQSLNTLLGSF
ncbi:unnamed protein product [Eruca vesicaria subsp. sativa]|uniref:Myb-like domain-containing protein n=1 Tax=Eruca vesicaria subsp. sativa TaxID=29727 RepID=A0ABC8LIA9_ERUVS|nr:unnamed protein product [Eruca vesicaria subsp. sativa]